jgi:hypothetical protein
MIRFRSYKFPRPTREQLCGMSPSEFKTTLRNKGLIVRRDFFKNSMGRMGGKYFRFRWWSEDSTVDVCYNINGFDRWANSTDERISLKEWVNK